MFPQMPLSGIDCIRWTLIKADSRFHILGWYAVSDEAWRFSTEISQVEKTSDGWVAITKSGSSYVLRRSKINAPMGSFPHELREKEILDSIAAYRNYKEVIQVPYVETWEAVIAERYGQ